MAVASLDYRQFTMGSKAEREAFAQALLQSFERTGFAKLHGHTFSEEEVQQLFMWSHKFFDQPMEAKNRILNEPGPRPMRGYTPWRVEEVGKLHHDAKIRSMTDSKEHFDQGPEYDTEFPNKWPADPALAGFRPFMEGWYRKCDAICLTLLEALEVAWDIPDGSLVARCVPSATDLRLTHYSAIPAEELQSGRTSRIAPHTDFGPMTLLFQDGTGGLEIEDRTSAGKDGTQDAHGDGDDEYRFVPLPPPPRTEQMAEMIINVGDTLTRWTNGKIRGGVHRVTAPAPATATAGSASCATTTIPSRMSMAYLFKAGRDVSVGPLPTFVSRSEPARYPDITALEFQRWRNSIVYDLN